MASRRFSLLFTSLLVTGVVVLYIISSKTENETFKIPEILSWNENARIRSNNFTPTSRQRTQNEETSSFSYAETLFRLYDEVESFVIFIGYSRSRHTLVAAILDAHPEIITVDVYNVLNHLNQSSTQKNMQKYRVFFGIHQLAREQAMFGNHACPSSQLTKRRDSYFYNVPGAWQGGYQEKLKVIGVKNAGAGTTTQDRLGVMSRCKAIQQAVHVPLKFIHVIRNPFDNIATMTLHATGSRDAVREEGVKIDNKEKLDAQIRRYFHMADNNQFVKEIYGDAVLDIPGHETVLRPRKTLQRLCDHLGVTCPEDYIEKCSRILFGNPSVTRHKVVWTEEQKERVTKMMQSYPFLKGYSFDKYPS